MYTLKHNPAFNRDDLYKGEAPCVCPFKNSVLIPGQIQGQLTINQFNCDTTCPLFELAENQKSVTLHCGAKRKFDIAIEPKQAPGPVSSLIIAK